MKVVKVRRVGNSNVISIPKELEAIGYTPGSSVLVEELPHGELRILPTDKVRERIREVGWRVVAEHPEALHPGRPRSGRRATRTVGRCG